MNKGWTQISTVIFLSSVLAGIIGFNFGYEKHRAVDLEKVRLAVRAKSSADLIPVVNATRDLAAGTVISMSDMVTEQVQAEKCPVGQVDSPYIAVGRRLIYGVCKGHFLALSDFGFSYPTPAPYVEPAAPYARESRRQ